MWWVPSLIFVATFSLGVLAATRWLPPLAQGPVGGLVFFVSSGLFGAAGALLGLHVYVTATELKERGGGLFGNKGFNLASNLTSMLFDTGLLLTAAAVVFLLAPKPQAGMPGESA